MIQHPGDFPSYNGYTYYTLWKGVIMPASGLPNLISYIVSELDGMGASLGKTKLVKLLYIIDVENYRRRSQTLSGLDWLFYHYGPYSFDIDTALKQLSLDLPQEQVTTQAGYTAITFKPAAGFSAGLGPSFSRPEQLVIDRVIRDWGMEELNPILDHVYFQTEPMGDAERGTRLDFTKIKPSPQSSSRRPFTTPPGGQSDRSSRFQEAKANRVRVALDPSPRYDEVFKQALERLEEEEQTLIHSGEVQLTESSKEHIREQGEEQ